VTATIAPAPSSSAGAGRVSAASSNGSAVSSPTSAGGGGRAAAGGMSLSKAAILNLDSGGAPIRCMFNPKEYTFNKTNSWKAGDTKGSNVPPLEFEKGQPATLQLQLLFDTYADGSDVRKEFTDDIWKLMQVDEDLKDKKNKKGRPPRVRFQWGKTWSFEGVITKISQKFTLFLPDGTPVRATLDVTFQQSRDESLYPRQNPTSGGQDTVHLWTVQEGDTLAWIAYKEYGDTSLWRTIADANRMTEVRHLRPGTVLEIPGA
jgi:hypothetical protein